MPIVSVIFGVLLTALGVWGYWGGDLHLWEPLGLAAPPERSWTALIPALLGVGLIVLGLLALKESLLKHAMHAASVLGLLGLLAGAGRLVQVLVTKGRPQGVAGVSVVLLALLSGVFLALCVNSFIQARRRRRAAAAAPGP